PRRDLYALAVAAYQLIAGRLPSEASSLTALPLKQQQQDPATLDTLVAAVGPERAAAVAIALALDPRDRYHTGREMGRALSDAARGIPPRHPRELERERSETEATSLLERGRAGGRAVTSSTPADAGAVAPLRPRRGPPREAPRARAAAAPPAPRTRQSRAGGRLLGALLLVLALAVADAALVRVA